VCLRLMDASLHTVLPMAVRASVCHATGIIPPSSPFRIWDLFGGEGAAAGFSDGVVEGFEGHVDHAPLIIVIPSRSRRWCAMFGSVWQAWGQ
jgi:hypothetical protein